MNFDISKIINPIFFQVVGTLILFGVIFKFTYKNYLAMLDKREKHINDNISQATMKNQQAQLKLDEVEQEQKDILKKRDEILSDAQNIAQQNQSQIIAQAHQDASEIINQAQQEINQSRKNVEQEVMADVFDYVKLVAKNYVNENIDQAKEQELIDAAIKKVANE